MSEHTQPDTLDHGVMYKHAPGFRLRRGRNWFFLGLTYASYYLCRYNISIIAPELKAGLGLSNTEFGLLGTARDGAYAIGQFCNGLLTDRLGGKQAMTIGAMGTVFLNVIFGFTTWSNISALFFALMLIRLADGYVQAFGAPGMIKINTAWFRRQERGFFAGIFGGMIQLGVVGVGLLGKMMVLGFTINLFFFKIDVGALGWRYMFFVPPAIVVVIITLMNLMVKNHPEDAGYSIKHDEEAEGEDPHEKIHLAAVFRKIVRSNVVWFVAGAYFCTGFVRQAINLWWVIWLKDIWHVGKAHPIFGILVWVIPVSAFLGSLGSGLISDKLVGGRRAPVAAVLYFMEALLIVAALLTSKGSPWGSAALAALLLVGINTACNATHSILGTAAPMDLGGRKMAGFASGVIDSFQYYGSMLAGGVLGKIMDIALAAQNNATTQPVKEGFQETVWFSSMIPFAVLGTVLMTFIWFRHRGTNERGT